MPITDLLKPPNTMRACITALFAVVAVCTVQAQQAGPLDTAPAPSERFPAAWYPPEDKFSTTSIPELGNPYVATLQTTTHFHDPHTGSVTTHTTEVLQARDSKGRKREETEMPRQGADGKIVMAREVTVHDLVAHCTFSWMEPWVVLPQYDQGPIATVTCNPLTAHLRDDNVFARTATTPEGETQRFNITRKVEHLPPTTQDGLALVATRITNTTKAHDGTQQQMSTDWIYSPELAELIHMSSTVTGSNPAGAMAPPDIHLINIRRVEPDANLFYPPVGYRIESHLPPSH